MKCTNACETDDVFKISFIQNSSFCVNSQLLWKPFINPSKNKLLFMFCSFPRHRDFTTHIIRILIVYVCFCVTLRFSTICYFSFLSPAASLQSSVLVIRLVISRHCSICKVQPVAGPAEHKTLFIKGNPEESNTFKVCPIRDIFVMALTRRQYRCVKFLLTRFGY